MKQSPIEKYLRNRKIHQMISEGTRINEIAFLFGLSESAVRYIYRKTWGKLPDKNKKRNKEICEKVLAGESYQQVGNKYGLTKESIRQIYHKSGRTVSPFKEKKKQENFKRIFKIAEKYMERRSVFPLKKEFLQFMISKQASSYNVEIYKKLGAKYKNLPRVNTINAKKRKAELLNDLKQLYATVKIPLSPALHLKEFKLASQTTYMKYFRTFKKACTIANIPCGKRGGDARRRSYLIRKSLTDFKG